MSRRLQIALVKCCFVAGATLLPLGASATLLQNTLYFNFIDYREASVFGPSETLLSFGGDFSPVSIASMSTAVETTVKATQGTLPPFNVPYLNYPAVPTQFFRSIPYYGTTMGVPNSTLTGAWTLTASNSFATNSPVVINTLPIPASLLPTTANPFPFPFINNVQVDGLSVNPTFSWSQPTYTAPSGTTASITVFVYDTSIAGMPAVRVAALPATATSYTVTNPLNVGDNYAISVETTLHNNADAGTFLPGNANGSEVETSRSFFDFTPQASAPPFPGPVNLPRVDPNGVFTFSLNVSAGVPVLLDPLVAIGYDFQIGAGNPDFASVEFPDLGSFDYDLYLWNGTDWVFDALVDPMTQFFFGGDGVDRFRVLGIDPNLMISPMNTTVFVTQVTFDGTGSFSGTMTPITTNVPEPATLALLGIGLAGLGFSRRKH